MENFYTTKAFSLLRNLQYQVCATKQKYNIIEIPMITTSHFN